MMQKRACGRCKVCRLYQPVYKEILRLRPGCWLTPQYELCLEANPIRKKPKEAAS